MRLSGETMGERMVKRAGSPGSRDDVVNTESNGYLQVRVERSVVMDNKPEDNKDIMIERKSDWDPGHTV